MRGAARYVEIDREQALDPVADLRLPAIEAAGNGAGAGGDDEPWFADGLVGHQQGMLIFAVTGPVTRMPSACRGEATNSMPNRLASNTMLPSAFASTSHPLQPPALT